MPNLMQASPEDNARHELQDAKNSLAQMVGSNFATPLDVAVDAVELTEMSGTVTYSDHTQVPLTGYMVEDTDWRFDLPATNGHPEQTIYIHVDDVEDFINDLETAEINLQKATGNKE